MENTYEVSCLPYFLKHQYNMKSFQLSNVSFLSHYILACNAMQESDGEVTKELV